MLVKTSLDQRQHISALLQQLPQEKLAVVYDFLSYLVDREEKQLDADAPLSAWLKVAEPSFEFWDNEKDAAYDNL